MKKTLVLFAFIVLSQVSKAQQGFGTNNPDPSAVIDMVGSTKGVLMPRVALSSLTVAAPVVSPADALTVFNTATNGSAPNNVTPGYYYWSASQNKWIRLLSEAIQDLRLVGTRSHITQDAGSGANGTSVGTGADNIGIGSQTLLSNNTGFANIGIGTEALSKNVSGSFNVALGTIALANATGDMNTGLGHGTGYDLTTGGYNTLIGAFAGHRITTAIGNIAIGHNAYATSTLAPATGNNNTLIGNEAGYILSSGSRNVGLGQSVFYSSGGFPTGTTTGNDNVALGYQSARNITTGSNNLAIGSGINVQTGTASNQMNIKNTIFGTGMSGTLAAPAGNIGINVAAPTNTLHVKAAADPARLEGLQTGTITGATPDNIVVSNSTGVLKTIAASTLASSLEPWNVQGGTTKATANGEAIYQNGKVGIGNFATVAAPALQKQLEVKGDFKSLLTSATTGNTMALEVNSPLGTEATGGYWQNAASRIHAFVADQTNVRAVALDNINPALTTKASNFEVGLDAVNVYSKHGGEAKQATLELNALNSQFALYANQYSTNVGSMVKSDGVNGLLLYNGGSSAATSVVDGNDRTQVTIKKAEGVTFSHYGPTSLLTGIYTFPTTSGTNGQVMVKGASNAISWANASTLATNNIYTADGSIVPAGGGTGVRTATLNGNELRFAGSTQRTRMLSAGALIQEGVSGSPSITVKSNDANSNGRVTNLYLQSFDDNAAQIFAGEGATSLTLGTHFTAVPAPIRFTTNEVANTTSTEKMRLTPTGQLAIGTTSVPTITIGASTINPLLHVAGDISTTGKIYTTNSVYADYVFEKYFAGKSEINPSYEFKSLDYVRNFIKANNHLPGVQSINDLTKANNGYTFDMTKLTIQSLEKIEELYIHTIEQKDKIDAQQAEIDKLKKEAEETKNRLDRLEKLLIKN